MKRTMGVLGAMLLAVTAAAATETESKWTISAGGKKVATVTLLTNGPSARAEWKKDDKAAPIIFIRANGKTWVRASGGDIELSAYKGGDEQRILPALLAADPGRTPSLKIAGGNPTYDATRTKVSETNADASNFTVRPRQGAASRLARLSGDLLGPTSSSASATAGGRGASGKGLKLDNVGNYDALAKVENRDDSWRKNLDEALAEFQKEGKVGKERP